MNVNWVEIPVNNLSSAMRFYEQVFGLELKVDLPGPPKMSFLPFDENQSGSSCALIEMPKFYNPSKNRGPLVYFTCNNIEETEKLISKHGGEVLIPRRQISPAHGYMAVFLDSENNRIALHSQL